MTNMKHGIRLRRVRETNRLGSIDIAHFSCIMFTYESEIIFCGYGNFNIYVKFSNNY